MQKRMDSVGGIVPVSVSTMQAKLQSVARLQPPGTRVFHGPVSTWPDAVAPEPQPPAPKPPRAPRAPRARSAGLTVRESVERMTGKAPLKR